MAAQGVNGCLTRLNFLWDACNTMEKQGVASDSILGVLGVYAYRSIPFVRCLPSLCGIGQEPLRAGSVNRMRVSLR